MKRAMVIGLGCVVLVGCGEAGWGDDGALPDDAPGLEVEADEPPEGSGLDDDRLGNVVTCSVCTYDLLNSRLDYNIVYTRTREPALVAPKMSLALASSATAPPVRFLGMGSEGHVTISGWSLPSGIATVYLVVLPEGSSREETLDVDVVDRRAYDAR